MCPLVAGRRGGQVDRRLLQSVEIEVSHPGSQPQPPASPSGYRRNRRRLKLRAKTTFEAAPGGEGLADRRPRAGVMESRVRLLPASNCPKSAAVTVSLSLWTPPIHRLVTSEASGLGMPALGLRPGVRLAQWSQVRSRRASQRSCSCRTRPFERRAPPRRFRGSRHLSHYPSRLDSPPCSRRGW